MHRIYETEAGMSSRKQHLMMCLMLLPICPEALGVIDYILLTTSAEEDDLPVAKPAEKSFSAADPDEALGIAAYKCIMR